jgi:hypothetical protein
MVAIWNRKVNTKIAKEIFSHLSMVLTENLRKEKTKQT